MLKSKFKKLFSYILAFTLGANFCCYSQERSVTANSNSHRDIMKKAYEYNPNFGESKIYDIAMLGSHDALSDKINVNSKNDYSTNVPELCGLENLNVVKQVSVNYAKAQADSLDVQLESGVRYIDARITCVDGIFYTKHSLLSGMLEDYLKQLIKFLIDNPGEFVVFDIASYNEYEKTENELAEYMQTVKVRHNNKDYNIYDFINYDTSKDFSQVTYNDVTKNSTSGGLIIVSNVFQSSPKATNKVTNPSLRDFFKYKAKYAHWYNDSSSSSLISKIDDLALSYEKDGSVGLICNQVQTTPDAKSITLSLTGSLLESAKKHNVAVLESPHFNYWLSVMPIMWFDNVTSDYENFNSRINSKILEYNLGLNNTQNSKFKVQKLTDKSQLFDDMKVIIRVPFTSNGFVDSNLNYRDVGSYKSNKFILNDDIKEFWTLKKTGDGWKIMLPDGRYLKRVSADLNITDTRLHATTFTIDIPDNGIAKIYEPVNPKRNMYLDGKKLDLSRYKSNSFEICAVKNL